MMMTGNFRPGMLTARDAETLNEFVRKVSALLSLSVAPPLSMTRNNGIPSGLTIALPPGVALARITGNDAATPPVYQATIETRDDANAVEDTYPVSTIENLLSPVGDTFATDDLVYAVPIAGQPSWYWGFPASSSSSSTVSAWKEPVRVATTTAGTLASSFENGDTVDGVTLATGDRILIKNQSSGVENGIYVVAASGAPTRATDLDAGTEYLGATVFVSVGTVNADTYWTCTTNPPATIGTDSLAFAQTPSASTTVAGYVNLTTQTFLGTKNIVADTTGTYGGITFAPNANTSSYSTISLYSDYTNPTTKAFVSLSAVSGGIAVVGTSSDTSGGLGSYAGISSGNNGTSFGDWPALTYTSPDGVGGYNSGVLEYVYGDPTGRGTNEYFLGFNDFGSFDMFHAPTLFGCEVIAGRNGSPVGGFTFNDVGTLYPGASGSFTTVDGKTVTVKGGIITSIV